jgi:glycine cleavage system H protein
LIASRWKNVQGELGDVVFVDLPEVGRQVSKGESFGVVESVKAASDIYSPISGEIVAVNSELAESPALVSFHLPPSLHIQLHVCANSEE